MCWDYVDCARCGRVYCSAFDEEYGVDCKTAECCEYCGDEICGICVAYQLWCPKGKCQIEMNRERKRSGVRKVAKYQNHDRTYMKKCNSCSCKIFQFEGKKYYFRNFLFKTPCECDECRERIFYVNFPSFNFKTSDKKSCRNCKQTLTGPQFTFECLFCRKKCTRNSCDKFKIAIDDSSLLNLVIMKCKQQRHICYQQKICDHASVCETGFNKYPCKFKCESFLKNKSNS